MSKNSRQVVVSKPRLDLGIVELDRRLEFTIDPLSQLVLSATAPKKPTLPTPGSGCVNTVAGC